MYEPTTVEEDLPIKMMEFRVDPAVVDVRNFVGTLAWDLRIDEAAVVKIIYPQGHSHRFHIWRCHKLATWTVGVS